jgi:DNA-binding LacI/PurR family transcriptional regulator
MKGFRVKSAVEQLAEHLRGEIERGELDGGMPGVAQLVRELGVGTKTVVGAMEVLKREGWLEGQGERKRSRVARADEGKRVGLQFSVMTYDETDARDEHMAAIRHRLEQAGHRVKFAERTMLEMKFDLGRVVRLVEKTGGDAWIIRAGPKPVLEWFAGRRVPAFAMFGRHTEVRLAGLGTLKSPAVAEALQRLVALGHRRIVMLAGEDRRKPTPGVLEQRFLDALERLGVEVGAFNLPDWENDRNGFHRCLDSLFRFTPPTAIFPGDPLLFFATQQYLLRRGIVVPRDVSLIAMDEHPAFEWFVPEVSRIRMDTRRWVQRVVEWAQNVARGKEDRRETVVRGEFVEGGTIGPAKRHS